MATFPVRFMAAYAALEALFSGRLPGARSQDGMNPSVTILVYNYAGLATDTLLDSEAAASRIFQSAGVDIIWRHCAVAASPEGTVCPPPSLSSPALRVVARFPNSPGLLHANTTGFSTGIFATVSAGYAAKIEREGIGRLPEVLGHVMAHELGHLFLAGEGHSRRGIMRAQWHMEEYALIAERRLFFDKEQGRLLRTEVLRRADSLTAQAH